MEIKYTEGNSEIKVGNVLFLKDKWNDVSDEDVIKACLSENNVEEFGFKQKKNDYKLTNTKRRKIDG